MSVEYAVGCRHPDTSVGDWDRAFVFCKRKGDNRVKVAMFMSGKDFIGDVGSYAEAYDNYQELIKEGWEPMNAMDIQKTAGIKTEGDKILLPWILRNIWWNKLRRIYFHN